MTRVAPWVLAVLLALCCIFVIVHAVRQERELSREQDRHAEAARLREENLEGVIVAERKTAGELGAELERAMKRSQELEAAVERARKASPGAKPVAVIQSSTGPLVASGLHGSEGLPPNQVDQRPCLLFAGDSLDLRVDQAILETRAGNHLVVGEVSAWKIEPETETKLAGGPFEQSVSQAHVAREEPLRRVGWGVGPSVWGSPSGLAYGALVSPPPMDLWRMQFEVAAGLGFGQAGVQGSASVLARVR